jgi:hypothetical protein
MDNYLLTHQPHAAQSLILQRIDYLRHESFIVDEGKPCRLIQHLRTIVFLRVMIQEEQSDRTKVDITSILA